MAPRTVHPKAKARSSFLSALPLIFALAACSTPFSEAMDRGDGFARHGQWDAAAQAYAEAVRLEPDDQDAHRKFTLAKQQQAKLRVMQASELLRTGRATDALPLFGEAVKLDPHNLLARQGFEETKFVVSAESRKAIDEQRFKDGYALAQAVLKADPAYEAARALEAEAKDKIAESAYQRGLAAEKAGQLSIALLENGEALQFKPLHPDAGVRAATIRKTLREQVTFFVAFKNFDGDTKADNLGADVNAAVISNGLNPELALRVVDTVPKDKSYKLQGIRLGGVFRKYTLNKDAFKTTRSCDYICGKEWVPNPNYSTAEANMKAAQEAIGMAEGRLSSAKAAVPPAERARDSAKTSLAAKKTAADQAEQDLQRCKSQSGGKSGACSSEEQRKSRAEQDEKLAADEADRAEKALQSAKSELSDAQSDADRKRLDAASKKTTFEQTPPKIEVDKHCTHQYEVKTAKVNGEVECMLRGEGMYDTEAVLNTPIMGRVAREDESFAAERGVCPELAAGDPMQLPSDGEMKKLVLASAIKATQQELVGAFDRYREGYLIRGRTAAIDQNKDDAANAFVKYLITLPKDDGSAGTDEAISALMRLRSLDEAAVRLAIFGAAKS